MRENGQSWQLEARGAGRTGGRKSHETRVQEQHMKVAEKSAGQQGEICYRHQQRRLQMGKVAVGPGKDGRSLTDHK